MLKNLKSLFVIEDEATQKNKTTKKATKNTPPPKKTPTETPSAPPTATNISTEGKVTKRFMDVLFKAMQDNNLDGFDYLEYKQSLMSLKKMPMDEATRFQSAFAMAQTMGANPDQLLKTAQHYIDVLDREEKKFEEALAAQRQKQIGSKKQAILKLEEEVKKQAEQIKKLTEAIETKQKKAQKLKEDISLASTKVEATKNDFIASFKSLVSQIQGDMENIKKYLK